ncbi:MAG: GNAT family N-acetyltransferase [Chloroflexi bacterium]|nr:GNAT family N-acetyltransferase [Chloroflexota bacterium]
MDNQLLTGKLTRLVAGDPDKFGELNAKWSHDSEFFMLFDSDPVMVRDAKRSGQFFRERAEKERPGAFPFLVQTLEDERLIGEGGLWNALSSNRDAWVSIGIGERELWGKGYGSDALNVMLRFAFRELNLHRVNLVTFEYNRRAIRAYEKLGFVHEGKIRGGMRRSHQRWAIVFMGILRDEWESANR